MVTQTDLDTVRSLVVPLVGKQAWKVRLGIGNFVTMEFGRQLTPNKFGRSYGEWHLWLCGCEWRIDQRDQIPRPERTPRSNLRVVVQELEGRTLLAVSLYSPAIDATFEFEGGPVIAAICREYNRAESWNLFTPQYKTCRGTGVQVDYAVLDIPRDET